jgi:hypothetical protein
MSRRKPKTTKRNQKPTRNHDSFDAFSHYSLNSVPENHDSVINRPFLSLSDLQLAAELGKTLLERNKELENLLRAHQKQCGDQKQEIEVSLPY